VVRDRISRWFATCSYIGYLPVAPGTWGSLLASSIICLYPRVVNPLIILLFGFAAVVTAERARGGEEDPGYIVIDEFVGVLVTMAFHLATICTVVAGFILFRAFDILKPYPIRRLERLPGGWGIVADDVLAGVFANAALFLAERLC
jgi:phosphatidylglycerophosphatase A